MVFQWVNLPKKTLLILSTMPKMGCKRNKWQLSPFEEEYERLAIVLMDVMAVCSKDDTHTKRDVSRVQIPAVNMKPCSDL